MSITQILGEKAISQGTQKGICCDGCYLSRIIQALGIAQWRYLEITTVLTDAIDRYMGNKVYRDVGHKPYRYVVCHTMTEHL